jgi:hypothetical protein
MRPIFMISICPSVQALATVSQVARISPTAVLPARAIGLAACKMRVGNWKLVDLDSSGFPLNAQKMYQPNHRQAFSLKRSKY